MTSFELLLLRVTNLFFFRFPNFCMIDIDPTNTDAAEEFQALETP